MSVLPPARSRSAATIGDVAKIAGVSPMTVSRVINNAASVKPATRARVEVAIAALRYTPNDAARHLARARQLRIGLLFSNPSAAYLSEFLVGCLDQAQRSGAQLIIEKCEPGEAALTSVRHMLEGGIDGVLLPPPVCDDDAVLNSVGKAGLPAIMIATGHPRPGTGAVLIDDAAAARAMTQHLIKLGHNRIGFVAGATNQTASAERLLGYRQALGEAGIPIDPALIAAGEFTYRSGLDAAESLLGLADPPTAIFAANDDMAAACMAVAHGRQLDVPGDLSICGFDDTPVATTIWPELTTIRQPIAVMAQTAVEMLVQTIREGSPARHQILEFALVRRQSDAVPRRSRRS